MQYEQKHVFAVWGPPIGGKTTFAVNLAVVLADSGYLTCLVSATDHGELQAFLGTAIPKNKGLYAAISNGRHVREALTEARPNLYILEQDTGGDAYDIANITPGQVKHMLDDLRDHFTYVIIDCTNYKESVFTGIGLVEADKVTVCIPHRASAATWHIANAQMLEAIADKTLFIDCNTKEGGCNMEQLLASIDLPECDFKLPRVTTAYLCENIAQPIVLKNGREERRYKDAVLELARFLLEIEDRERADKKAKKQKKEKKSIFAATERESDGIRTKKISKRAQRKAEEEAMRQAQMAYSYDDDDED